MSPEFYQRLAAAELPPVKSRALLEELGSFGGDPSERLRKLETLSPNERKRLDAADMEALSRAMRAGIQVLPESAFSENLIMAENMPPMLFVDGDPSCLHAPTVAIVGTRNASTYGKACAQKFAEALSRAGVTVVSGGALGIDAAAHKGALAGGGFTAAVLAGGVDYVYPAVNGGLFEQIKLRGCLVSQFAVGSKPAEYKFLQRNVVIAALCDAVLVVEAPTRSGALTTAHAAAELGRDVFVVPGNIDLDGFRGSFNLIRDGAALVSHPNQILDQMQIEPAQAEAASPASSLGEKILGVLGSASLATEFIVERTGLDTAEVLSELTMLELEGRVMRDASGYALRP